MTTLENDIIEDINKYYPFEKKILIVTYRLKERLLESGNKIGIPHFETSKFRWHD